MTVLQYAEVRPYHGCPELLVILRPFLGHLAAGAGFGLVLVLHRLVLFCWRIRLP